jgi:hypothetical protein
MPIPVPDIAYDCEHFTLEQLARILPIAQTRQIDEMQFTLLALECYRAGYVATVLTQQDWRVPDPPPTALDESELPQLLKGVVLIGDAIDDLGNRYLGRIRSGAGGGGEDGLVNHEVHCFAPALHPTAGALTLTLAQVKRPRYDADGRPAWRDNEVLAGPWTLVFSLSTPPEHSDAPVSIVPVAARIAVADVAATVTTIERYASGFVVNSRLDWPSSDGPFPHPIWRASDDRGGRYGTGNCAGGGNAAGDSTNTWRMYCSFRPALDPAATELRLQLASLGLRRAVRNEEQNRFDHWETARQVTDLGEITVTLPPQEHALTRLDHDR